MWFDDSSKKLKEEIDKKIDRINAELKDVKSLLPSNSAKVVQRLKELKDNAEELHSHIERSYSNIESNEKEFIGYYAKIKSSCESFEREISALEERRNKLDGFYNQVDERESKLQSDLSTIQTSLDEIAGYLEDSKEFPTKIEEIEGLLSQFKESNASIELIKTNILKRRSEIDAIHKEILGHDIKNESGVVEHVDGLRDELVSALYGLENKVKNLGENYNKELDIFKNNYNSLLNEDRNTFLNLFKETEKFINETKQRILELLPGAMAAGLSHAYEEKRNEEVAFLTKSEDRFLNSIYCLFGISSLPVLIAIYMLSFTDKNLFAVIDYLPKLMSAFIPLYIPVFWVAYSTNKKINLSKRIIEEYTHKEVLGKTFSGLSNQIDKASDNSGIQNELRMKLLFNFMQVTAENPGKLISDYNTADHPVMDAIEKSAKLTDALERIARIPGFAPVAKKLAEKAEEFLDKNTKKVEDGININEILNNESKENNKEDAANK